VITAAHKAAVLLIKNKNKLLSERIL